MTRRVRGAFTAVTLVAPGVPFASPVLPAVGSQDALTVGRSRGRDAVGQRAGAPGHGHNDIDRMLGAAAVAPTVTAPVCLVPVIVTAVAPAVSRQKPRRRDLR
jgi:hypothetical protein